jgi:hypothetical protein
MLNDVKLCSFDTTNMYTNIHTQKVATIIDKILIISNLLPDNMIQDIVTTEKKKINYSELFRIQPLFSQTN